jgi:hypothetical protein
MKKAFLAIILAVLSQGVFPFSLELFTAFPFIVSDISEYPAVYKATAVGIGITTLERGATFGLTAWGIAYSPYSAESLKREGSGLPDQRGISEVFMLPFGFQLSLGCSVLPFETKTVVFPVTVSFHSKTDFLKSETHIDMGIAAAAGIKYQLKRWNFFVRAEMFFDMYRIVIPYRGKLDTKGPNVLGIVPHAGIGFTI